MPSTTLSYETIVDIAKDMLTALECEWKMSNGKVCGAVLGSWHLLEKHLLIHSKTKTHLGSNWLCKLPKCNSPVHSSLQQLQEHVQLSHLSRVALPCPFTFCTSCPSIRLNQLSSHFDEEHSELDGTTIAIHDSEIILPTWVPFLPLLDNAPCLPKLVFPGTCLTMSVGLHPAPKHMELDVFSSQPAGMKHRPQLARNWTEPEEPPKVMLDSLTHWQGDTEDYRRWFNTLHPSWSPVRDMSRPQGMHGTIYRQAVSPTIHFAVFARKIDEMEKAGYCK